MGISEIASLEIRHRIGCVPEPLCAVADGEDGVGEHRRHFRGELLSWAGGHNLRPAAHLIGFTLDVGDKNEVAFTSITTVTDEAFHLFLHDAVIGLRTNGLDTNLHCEEEHPKACGAVDDDRSIWTPRIHRSELPSCALVFEVAHHLEHALIGIVLASPHVLDLAEGFEGRIGDEIRCGSHGGEAACNGKGEHMPVKIIRDLLPLVCPVSDEGLIPSFEAEEEDLEAEVYEGADRAGLPGSTGTLEENIHSCEEARFRLSRRL